MKRRISFLSSCLALLLVLGHRAPAESQFAVDVWSTADGLPQSSVIALTQTRDGYLWLGTLNGLVRFDGNSFTPFNLNNTPGLPGNGIVFLFEDRRTNLWVGTSSGGLCRIQNGVINSFQTGDGNILNACEDESGAVWFCEANGRLLCWRNGQMNLHPEFTATFWEQLFQRAFHRVVPAQNNIFWHLAVQSKSVEQWQGDQLQKNYGAFPWFSAVVGFPLNEARTALSIDSVVTATGVDANGKLVVGTHGEGIFWMDGQGGWRHIINEDKRSSQNFVLSVCFDREGNLWVGTDGGGLYRVRKKYFETSENLPNGVAKSIAEDASGGLWVTYNARGLVYAVTNSQQFFGIGRGSNAWSVLVDQRQNVWAGTSGEGLFRLNSGSFENVFTGEKIGPKICALFETRDGNIWAGGQNGLGCFDGQNWKFYSAADGLPPNAICALGEDSQSNLWIGTDGGGLFSKRGDKFVAESSPVKDISCLLVDRNDHLWAGTSGHGLARLADGHWTSYTAADGLAGDDIGYLLEDEAGNLWIGSYEGLIRADKKSLVDFSGDPGKKISCRTFLSRECPAGAQPAALRTRDGKLWFPTIEGLVSVNPRDLTLNTNRPPVIIESVLVDGVELKTNLLAGDWNRAITLTPENEQLEIHFTSLNFSAPKGVQFGARFKYWVEGRDKNWTDARNDRVVDLNRLAPGPYTFHVIACNEDGVWSDHAATLAITVEPPFWRKPSFVAAMILFLVAALGGVIYLISTAKLKRQLRALHQKELIERERARIARDLHDQLGANLTQVTLLGEMAELDKDLPGEVEQHAQQICATARETTRSLDEIVWAVNPSNDTLEGLANYACKYAQDYFALAGVSFRADLPADLPPTPILPEVRHNVFLAFKEAVNNVVKHAHATEARVKLHLEPEKFSLSIRDNGRGLGDISGKALRNGLKNMRRRLADVRGEFIIEPGAGGGTLVTLVVPLKNP